MESWKVVLLGDTGAGKRALAVRFTMNAFVESYDPTLEDGYRKQLNVDGRVTFVEVINAPGVPEYEKVREAYIREGQAFGLVYSVASLTSFKAAVALHRTLLEISKGRPPFILVGNKCDKEWEREVPVNDGEAAAQRMGCDFVETSARTGQNVDALFSDIVRMLRVDSGIVVEQVKTEKRGKGPRKKKCVVM